MNSLKLSSLSLLLLLTGCKTVDGITSAASNLIGNNLYENIEGKYIDDEAIEEFKIRKDELTGQGGLISYSGIQIPLDQIRQTSLIHSPELTTYLQNITDHIIKQWPGTPIKSKVVIVNSYTFGPYVDQFGVIHVPLGMLENVESEDEIASLLSHEVGHILLRHHERSEVVKSQQEYVKNIASTVVVVNTAKNTKLNKVGENYKLIYTPTEQSKNNTSKAAIYSYLINSLSDNVWSTAWARNQEDEADLLGLDLLVHSGYSPRAASHTLDRLSDFQGKQKSILNTFIDNKKEALANAWQEGDMAALGQEASTTLLEGTVSLIDSTTDYLKKSHMSPADRNLNLRHYIRKEYRSKKRKRVNKTTWKQMKSSLAVRNILEGYKFSYQATNAISQSEYASAKKLFSQSLNPHTSNQPAIREVAYTLNMAQGKPIQAEQHLAFIEHWGLASPNFYKSIIEEKMKKSNFVEALKYIEKAEKYLHNNEMFIVEKSIALNQEYREEDSIKSLHECTLYSDKKATCENMLNKLGIIINS
ncbi:M48 family metallopeptidase [Thalassomonas haliotis]|uniref:M48 family metalloprotease n=1 Tax=Thalassomonas haliotis TaxID=485448 RepID=A0ABY7VDU1_9GAMM|nr:M48 family metallopeptidase [Thalassomonas haliotis]WDE11052.1 M48 family metalloprotease [Thalassomonas haliotis]